MCLGQGRHNQVCEPLICILLAHVKKPAKKTENSSEVETAVDDGYDGYYDDIRPIDEGREREGVDKELIKKIAVIIGVLFIVIAACVALMYVL